MSRKSKVTAAERIKVVRAIVAGKICMSEADQRLKIASTHIYELIYRYEAGGEAALAETKRSRIYSEEVKLQAIMSYLHGEGSQKRISARFDLRPSGQLRD